MRIQHNIMAMSAYRNYTNNVSAMKSNLEKLSSGYKINRAGDDAAGLAISEKMRAQITGLETAQKNAKDGISLVQTAEGALTEVHDMLNRMVELATQSANGTYDNDTDRYQLQKEMDQLREEINRIADSSNFNGIQLLDGSMEADSVKYEVKNSSDLTILAGGTTVVSAAGASTITHVDGAAATATKFVVELENVNFVSTDATDSVTVSIKIGTATITAGVSSGVNGATLATAFKTQSSAVAIGGVTFNVTTDGSKLVFTMSDESVKAATAGGSFSGNFAVEVVRTNANGDQVGTVNLGTQVIEPGNPLQNTTLANTRTDAAVTPTDGMAITVGDTTYVFAATQETLAAVKAAGSGFQAVDITDLADSSGALQPSLAGTGSAVAEALDRLTVVAKDNAMFTVGHDANNKLTFQEKSTYKGGADLTTQENVQKQIQTGTFSATTVKAKSGSGTGLTLQIGPTADSYNQLKVSISDCHTSAMGDGTTSIADISIADQDSAAKALDVIKAAINYVSDVRGTLGATQNRLDHTINNLSVMTENIQDAESTIRDVDVAEEMMAYTKNNILIQASQAMLAQANQVPQGVLQLLQ